MNALFEVDRDDHGHVRSFSIATTAAVVVACIAITVTCATWVYLALTDHEERQTMTGYETTTDTSIPTGGVLTADYRAMVTTYYRNLGIKAQFDDGVRPRRRNPKLDVKPLVEELARIIIEGQDDPRVKWSDDGSVLIKIGKVIPDNASPRTVSGRRKRFRAALADPLHQEGWGPVSATNPNRFVKDQDDR